MVNWNIIDNANLDNNSFQTIDKVINKLVSAGDHITVAEVIGSLISVSILFMMLGLISDIAHKSNHSIRHTF